MSELSFILDQLCNNPCCLYTFYERYFWWIWEGTNVCDFFGRDINTGAAILKLFLVGPVTAVCLISPIPIYMLTIHWWEEVCHDNILLPCGISLGAALDGRQPPEKEKLPMLPSAPKDQAEIENMTLLEKVAFWKRGKKRFYLRDKHGNIVNDRNGNPIIRDAVLAKFRKKGELLVNRSRNVMHDRDGDPIVVNNMFYHSPIDNKFHVKPEYSEFSDCFFRNPLYDDDEDDD